MARLIGLTFALTLFADVCLAETAVRVDYPTPFVLYQQGDGGQGPMRIRGRVEGIEKPGKIEARFNGGQWQPLDPAPADGTFSGTIVGRMGQGRLDVRLAGDHAQLCSVEPVAVGDLFLIAGQSNADGRGDVHIKLADSNPFTGVKFRAGEWSRGDDPSDKAGKHGSPWPMVLNKLIPQRRVPMGFIQAAVGSTVVRQWRGGGSMYARAMEIVRQATDGGMGVKAVLYYQGENDITHYNKMSVLGDYRQYKMHLAAMVDDFNRELHAPVLVGQITNLGGNRQYNDGIRRAQQEIWSENDGALPGAVTHDIFPTDGCHYRTEANMRAFADRWSAAIGNLLDERSSSLPPRLLEAKRLPDNRVRLVYDCELTVSDWKGTKSARPLGFRIEAGEETLTDKNISSARVDGKTVLLHFNKPIPPGAKLFFGSGSDSQGKPVPRNSRTGQPILLLFAVPLP